MIKSCYFISRRGLIQVTKYYLIKIIGKFCRFFYIITTSGKGNIYITDIQIE